MGISDIVFFTNFTKIKVLLKLKEQSAQLMVTVLLARVHIPDGSAN